MKETMQKIKEEGNYFTFKYRGITCYGIRHFYMEHSNSYFKLEKRKDIHNKISSFHWCGYIVFPFKTDTDRVLVHGGVTCEDSPKLGFDCAHSYDIFHESQYLFSSNRVPTEYYRTKEYVTEQLKIFVNECYKYKNKREYLFK